MKKIFLWFVLVIVIILIAIPGIWSLSPAGAVRTRMLLDMHPVKALKVNPYRSYSKPKPKGMMYSYSTRFGYADGDAGPQVNFMMIKKTGIFYKATPMISYMQ